MQDFKAVDPTAYHSLHYMVCSLFDNNVIIRDTVSQTLFSEFLSFQSDENEVSFKTFIETMSGDKIFQTVDVNCICCFRLLNEDLIMKFFAILFVFTSIVSWACDKSRRTIFVEGCLSSCLILKFCFNNLALCLILLVADKTGEKWSQSGICTGDETSTDNFLETSFRS